MMACAEAPVNASGTIVKMMLCGRRMRARLHVLPLVCQRWARVMKASAEVWQQAGLELTEIMPNGPDGERRSLDLPAMATWFQARPGRMRELGLSCSDRTLQLPAAMTAMLLSTQAASLRRLSIDVSAYDLRGAELGIIAAIPGLLALDVRVGRDGFSDRGAAVIQAAQHLTGLTLLEVSYIMEPGETSPLRRLQDADLPRC